MNGATMRMNGWNIRTGGGVLTVMPTFKKTAANFLDSGTSDNAQVGLTAEPLGYRTTIAKWRAQGDKLPNEWLRD